MDEDKTPKKPVSHEVGADISTLSIADIDARIELLHNEINRLNDEKAKKQQSRLAADAFFKR